MPRPLKPTNPYASWTALFGATLQRLRQDLSVQPVVTQAEFGRRVHASGSKVSAIERGQVRPDAAFVEACERELPAGGILRAMLPLVIREWEQWARLGTTPPTGGLLPPDGVPPPGEVAAAAAELADVAFLEAAADGASRRPGWPGTPKPPTSAPAPWRTSTWPWTDSAVATPARHLPC